MRLRAVVFAEPHHSDFQDTISGYNYNGATAEGGMEAHRDRALCELVRRCLMSDKRLAGQTININSSAGYIQITGVVDTIEHKTLAIEIAWGVIGVRGVEDLIEIREQKNA